MPNTKSAKKAARASLRKRKVNSRTREKVKKAVKAVKAATLPEKVEDAAKLLAAAMSSLDKAVKKGVIKKKTASRKKSRLQKAINKAKKK